MHVRRRGTCDAVLEPGWRQVETTWKRRKVERSSRRDERDRRRCRSDELIVVDVGGRRRTAAAGRRPLADGTSCRSCCGVSRGVPASRGTS